MAEKKAKSSGKSKDKSSGKSKDKSSGKSKDKGMEPKKPHGLKGKPSNNPKGTPENLHKYNTIRYTPESDQDKMEVQRMLGEVLIAFKQKPVRNDDELRDRLAEYFEHCSRNSITPTIEEMFLYTGHSTRWAYNVEAGKQKGFTPDTADLVRKAKEFVKTFDAKLVTAGKINFLAYCFRAKNYYGMSDKQEVVITPTNPLGEGVSTEELQKKYLEDTYGAGVIDSNDSSDSD